uniref:Uncharacterized protein n=1 Tax=Peronospora matthiolae TaxID=2874970 RepID=A0AAV1U3B1_9STRA
MVSEYQVNLAEKARGDSLLKQKPASVDLYPGKSEADDDSVFTH